MKTEYKYSNKVKWIMPKWFPKYIKDLLKLEDEIYQKSLYRAIFDAKPIELKKRTDK